MAKAFRPVSEEDRAWIREQVYAGAEEADRRARENGSWHPDMTTEELRTWAVEHGVDLREPPS